MKIVVLGFYDPKHADAFLDTMEDFPMNIKELGEFVQQAEVLADFTLDDE